MKSATFKLRINQFASVILLSSGLAVGCSPTAYAPVDAPVRNLDAPLSGIQFQSDDIQTLQADDFGNPGMLWVDTGQSLWADAPTGGVRSCRDCHGALDSMRGVATRYPVFDESTQTLQNLTQRIEQCRTRNQQQPPSDYESEELLSLTAAVTHQSRGLSYQVEITGGAAPFFEQGQTYFYARRGQMNLACHHCHEVNAGLMLRGEKLSQGHPNGYPTYRLQWQTLGSLHRRLRFCNQAIRAEPFPYGAPEYVNLELFLAWRAGSLALEAPAVRR